jgi:hypothetical protein
MLAFMRESASGLLSGLRDTDFHTHPTLFSSQVQTHYKCGLLEISSVDMLSVCYRQRVHRASLSMTRA